MIIVEELQEFSKREKQVLIYTLLDLMHREDLLFVVRYCSVFDQEHLSSIFD